MIHYAHDHVARTRGTEGLELQRSLQILQTKRWVWPECMVAEMRRLIADNPRITPRRMILALIELGFRVPPASKFSYKVYLILMRNRWLA
jgi:hypothetical protein